MSLSRDLSDAIFCRILGIYLRAEGETAQGLGAFSTGPSGVCNTGDGMPGLDDRVILALMETSLCGPKSTLQATALYCHAHRS